MNNSSKIKLVILVAIFGCNMMLWNSGRGMIEGVVKDSSGEIVAGATVTTSPLGYSDTTDSNGEYIITDIISGAYTMSASYGSLSGSSSTVITDGGFFSCKGDAANCPITVSSTSSSGWTTLTSPLDGTYSGEGYYLTTENSPYEVTGDVYFYQTNVEIKDNVIINFIGGPDNQPIFTIGENTNVIFGNNIEFIGANDVNALIKIEDGSKIILDDILSEEIYLVFQREVDISNSTIYVIVIDVESTGTNSIEYSNIDYITLEGNAIGDITYCNTKDISLRDNSSAIVSNCNFPVAGFQNVFKNNTPNSIDATNNWWLTIDTTTISTDSIYDFYDNSAYGIVTFEPILTSTVTAAGPQ